MTCVIHPHNECIILLNWLYELMVFIEMERITYCSYFTYIRTQTDLDIIDNVSHLVNMEKYVAYKPYTV